MKHITVSLILVLALLNAQVLTQSSNSGRATTTSVSAEVQPAENSDASFGFTENTYCDPNNRPEVCTQQYDPVCAYLQGCPGGICTRTFGNACTACGNPTVLSHIPGSCEDQRSLCDPNNRPRICTLQYTPICAIASDCTGNNCYQNAGNECSACGVEGADYYLRGNCPQNSIEPTGTCDPSNRPEICTQQYDPVCGLRSNCIGESCRRTFGNACTACSNETIISYVSGECN